LPIHLPTLFVLVPEQGGNVQSVIQVTYKRVQPGAILPSPSIQEFIRDTDMNMPRGSTHRFVAVWRRIWHVPIVRIVIWGATQDTYFLRKFGQVLFREMCDRNDSELAVRILFFDTRIQRQH